MQTFAQGIIHLRIQGELMQNRLLSQAIEKLADDFARRDWKYLDVEPGSRWEKTFCWPGQQKEEIMICVHKGNMIQEDFHRQDFFFFNFAYKGSYGAFSYRYDNHITVREGEMPGMRSVSGMKKNLSLSGSSCVRRHFSAPFCPSCLQMPAVPVLPGTAHGAGRHSSVRYVASD